MQTTVPLALSQGGTDLNFTSAERTLICRSDGADALMGGNGHRGKRSGSPRPDVAINASQHGIASPAGLGTYPRHDGAGAQFFTDAATRLDVMAAPRDKQRSVVMSPRLNGSMVQALSGCSTRNRNSRISTAQA